MKEYIKLFNNHQEYEAFTQTDKFKRPNVSHCIEENEVHYNPFIHDYSLDYLTFVALENNTSFGFTDRLRNYQLLYSLNNGSTWTVLEGDNTVTINTDEKILWKGELIPTRKVIDPSNIGVFTSTKHFNAMGNIMSLAYSDDFAKNNTLPENTDFFKKLFMESNVVDAENLVLPATILTDGCYSSMFYDCTSLTTAPSILPATTLAAQCYDSMFYGCTSLTTAPELPATLTKADCYYYMFMGCTSLEIAPILPATSLSGPNAYSCYYGMFRDCTKLKYVKCFATDISGNSCIYLWLDNVAENGTFVCAPNTSDMWSGSDGYGHHNTPESWTIVEESN